MVKRLGPVVLVISMMVAAALACNFSFSTAKINNAHMALDEDGDNETTTFSTTDTVYAVLDLDNAPSDTTIHAKWVAVEVPGEESGTVLLESEELETGSGDIWFSLEPGPAGLPPGEYKVDIYLNGEKEETLDFIVSAQ